MKFPLRSNCLTKALPVNVMLSCKNVSLFSNKGDHSLDKSVPVLLLKRCRQKKSPVLSEKKSHGSLGLCMYNLSHTVSSLCYKTRAKSMLICCDIYASAKTIVMEQLVCIEVWDLKVCGCTNLAIKLFCCFSFFPWCQVSFKELQTSWTFVFFFLKWPLAGSSSLCLF